MPSFYNVAALPASPEFSVVSEWETETGKECWFEAAHDTLAGARGEIERMLPHSGDAAFAIYRAGKRIADFRSS